MDGLMGVDDVVVVFVVFVCIVKFIFCDFFVWVDIGVVLVGIVIL